ncbi:MAG TPA: hypothetical protein PKD61_25220 [Polyangiaceae bacterium]|nr:hypothetical protein [Polyangiaceae bacterium]
MKTRTHTCLALVALFATLPHCTSEDSPSGGGSGGLAADARTETGGSNGAADSAMDAPAQDAADADAGCTHYWAECCGAKYDLGADADTAGLCEPAENIECSCIEHAAAGTVQCTSDGTVCCLTVQHCNPSPRCGWVDCGPSEPLPSCPASQQVFDLGRNFTCIPCTKDEHCNGDKHCSVRLANRMFCEQ